MKQRIIHGLMIGLAILAWVPFTAAADESQMSTEILVYINQYRVQHGLPKLVMNSAMTREAAIHSQEMAQHALPFGHDGFGKRIAHLHQRIPESSSGAENVAYNYKTAKIVVDGWIKSPGHRRNIVGHYNMTGIGIARDKLGKIYYTQLFLRTDKKRVAMTTHRVRQQPRPLALLEKIVRRMHV